MVVVVVVVDADAGVLEIDEVIRRSTYTYSYRKMTTFGIMFHPYKH